MNETNFITNQENKTINIQRIFNAPKAQVWQAWTTKELLEKWWAPKPWKAIIKTFDFSPGGSCLYYMSGPEGEKHWCWAGYETIIPEDSYTASDAFCDEEGNKSSEIASMHWRTKFQEQGNTTKVLVTITFGTLENLNQIVGMGFKEGFAMALTNLDEVLETMA